MRSKRIVIENLPYMVLPMDEFRRLKKLDDSLKVSRIDIANELGINKSTLSRKPWLIPNCDKGTKGIRGYKWTKDEWERWKRIPEYQRKKEYEDAHE